MYPKKNGVIVSKFYGNEDPVELWNADLQCCSNCNLEIVAGWGGMLTDRTLENFDSMKRLFEERENSLVIDEKNCELLTPMPPSCVACSSQMKRSESKTYLVKMFLNPPQPYQIFIAKLFECETCPAQVVIGDDFGKVNEHFKETFDVHYDMINSDESAFVVHEYEKAQIEIIGE